MEVCLQSKIKDGADYVRLDPALSEASQLLPVEQLCGKPEMSFFSHVLMVVGGDGQIWLRRSWVSPCAAS